MRERSQHKNLMRLISEFAFNHSTVYISQRGNHNIFWWKQLFIKSYNLFAKAEQQNAFCFEFGRDERKKLSGFFSFALNYFSVWFDKYENKLCLCLRLQINYGSTKGLLQYMVNGVRKMWSVSAFGRIRIKERKIFWENFHMVLSLSLSLFHLWILFCLL